MRALLTLMVFAILGVANAQTSFDFSCAPGITLAVSNVTPKVGESVTFTASAQNFTPNSDDHVWRVEFFRGGIAIPGVKAIVYDNSNNPASKAYSFEEVEDFEAKLILQDQNDGTEVYAAPVIDITVGQPDHPNFPDDIGVVIAGAEIVSGTHELSNGESANITFAFNIGTEAFNFNPANNNDYYFFLEEYSGTSWGTPLAISNAGSRALLGQGREDEISTFRVRVEYGGGKGNENFEIHTFNTFSIQWGEVSGISGISNISAVEAYNLLIEN